MAYVINEPCIGTKDTSCVEVCPVDCIHPTPTEHARDHSSRQDARVRNGREVTHRRPARPAFARRARWSDAYPRFLEHVRSTFTCVRENDELVIFAIGTG